VEGSFFKRQELPNCCDLHLGLVSIYSALFLGHKRSACKTYGNSDLAFPLNTQYNYLPSLEHTTHLVCVGCRIINTMSWHTIQLRVYSNQTEESMSSMSQTAVRGSYYFHPLQRVMERSLMSHRACCHTCFTIKLMHYSHFKTHSL
jgi:hypothetical protein